MQRFKIVHNTFYNFSGPVTLGPHQLRLRPREDHELRIESSKLNITPPATLLWRRDVESNSVALATFKQPSPQLAIKSEVVIQQYNEDPLDFLVSPEAVNFPFAYQPDDAVVLFPYMGNPGPVPPAGQTLAQPIRNWVANLWRPCEPIQTYVLLQRLATQINKSMTYRRREEPGVQTAEQTLLSGTGSCRDFATLFMEAARSLGLAARFVTGYLHAPPSNTDFGATHAWAEVYLPGAGWKGFDPTIGAMAGPDHIAVAVARSPESVPPVEGTFTGPPGSRLDVGVWVTKC